MESPCMGMGMALIPMGLNSHPSADAMVSLCDSNVQFIDICLLWQERGQGGGRGMGGERRGEEGRDGTSPA